MSTTPASAATAVGIAADAVIASGRGFIQLGEQGVVDGVGASGIYADDLRLLRRLEVFRAERDVVVRGDLHVDARGCAARFHLADVRPGTGVLLVVELDGTDLFTVRDEVLAPGQADPAANGAAVASVGSQLALGAARPDARVRLVVEATGAELTEVDGIAQARVPLVADGTPRTGSWRWMVPEDAPGAVDVTVELRAAWALSTDDRVPELRTAAEFAAAREARRNEFLRRVPTLTGSPLLEQVVGSSLQDLELLRLRTGSGEVPVAGAPWFMTVFGRDALLTAWMSLPVDPTIATATLRHLAQHQATAYDIERDAEPGKIQHEERVGVSALRWHDRYYGAADTTPLWLMLLEETWRWSGDDALVRELQRPARAAAGWLLARLEDDELGLVGYRRRAARGLDVQSWKDSPVSQRDNDGLVATGSMRALEVQAYAVAALRGAARMAASVWGDPDAAAVWTREADALERRLAACYSGTPEDAGRRITDPDDPRAEGFLAQALDAGGARVDALCSNVGHVLWADALPDAQLRAAAIRQLQHPALWSGWGIRTMSTLDAGYDPVSYHCGSVWPHDTALAIAGIARTDRDAAGRLAHGLLEAASALGGHLPELFSGAARGAASEQPGLVHGACVPQAWAAAAPLLVLRAVLGLEPDPETSQLTARTDAAPEWCAGLAWHGVHAFGQRWNVDVTADRAVHVTAAD